MSHPEFEFVIAPRLEQDVLEYYQTIRFAPIPEGVDYEDHQKNIDQEFKRKLSGYFSGWRRMMMGEFKHEVRQFEKSYDNQQAEQISLMV